MKNDYKFLSAIFLICIIYLSSCGKEDSTANSNEVEKVHAPENDHSVSLTSAQFKNAGIEFGEIEQKQISGTIKVNGVLDVPPQQLVSISVPLGGFLKNTTLL